MNWDFSEFQKQISDSVQKALRRQVGAGIIARTEAVRAYNEGSFKRAGTRKG